MLYAILCYHSEKEVCSWSKEHDDAVMERLQKVQDGLRSAGKLGPVAKLDVTGKARTLRKDVDPPLVLDGPFAETKEQLLGFFVVDCRDDDEVMAVTRALGEANPGGAYEVRPLTYFAPNGPVT